MHTRTSLMRLISRRRAFTSKLCTVTWGSTRKWQVLFVLASLLDPGRPRITFSALREHELPFASTFSSAMKRLQYGSLPCGRKVHVWMSHLELLLALRASGAKDYATAHKYTSPRWSRKASNAVERAELEYRLKRVAVEAGKAALWNPGVYRRHPHSRLEAIRWSTPPKGQPHRSC